MDKDKLRTRQAELIRIVEAIDEVLKNRSWQVLKEIMFDEIVLRIERQLLAEAKKPRIESELIYTLQGELATAKRYDLATYAERLKKELEGIKLNLQ